MFSSRHAPALLGRSQNVPGVEQSSRSWSPWCIHVGHLPRDVTVSELVELFSNAGKVIDVDIIRPSSTQLAPYAFLNMDDNRSATAAISAYNGMQYYGQKLKVESAKRKFVKNAVGPRMACYQEHHLPIQVTVRGLPPTATWQDLKAHMGAVGKVGFVQFPKRGWSSVQFLDVENISAAIQKLDGSLFRSGEGETASISVRWAGNSVEYSSEKAGTRSRSRSPMGSRWNSSRRSSCSSFRSARSVLGERHQEDYVTF